MKKQTKLFTTLSAAALLTIGVSAVSMAAGWDNSTGVWRYLNSDGTEVTDTWKSANGNWFYLDSNGEMATNQLIEDNNNSKTRYYYVDQYGAMVRNTWKAVAMDDSSSSDNVDAEYWWYYFGNDGKAYTNDSDKLSVSKIKNIDGKKYAFDSEGHMLFGWLREDGVQTTSDDNDAWKDALFFANGWNDGHIQTGWAKLTVEDDDETKEYWFYFNNEGKKAGRKNGENQGERKKINGVYYHFADDGHMLTNWAVGTASIKDASASTTAGHVYLNGDGSERKNKWVWAVPDEDETIEALHDDYEDDTYRWWYFGNDGKLTRNKKKKINGKYYVFDEHGRMKKGFVKVDDDNTYEAALKKVADCSRADILSWDYTEGVDGIYYFSNDEEKDGSMKKGYQTIDIDEGSYQFYFNTSNGKGETKWIKKINKYTCNGLVLAPTSDDNSNYAAVDPDNLNNGLYYGQATVGKVLVNKSGNKMKNKSKLKDSNDEYYITNSEGVVEHWFADEDAYKQFKSNQSSSSNS